VASGGGRGGEIVSSVAVITDPYTAAFAAREPDALQELRAAAMERFVSLGFPTIKNEEWRFTNLAPFLKEPYAPAPQPSFELVERQGGAGIVFMDGWFMPELSVAPAGIELRSLLDGPGAGLVGRGAAFEKNALVALNTAMFAGGVYIRIPDGTVLDEPISILHAATAARRQASFPRVLVVAGRDVQARVIEYFASTGEQFTCAVTEISAAEGAHIEHYKIQMESGQALHFGHLATRQGRSSTVASFNIAFGAALARRRGCGVHAQRIVRRRGPATRGQLQHARAHRPTHRQPRAVQRRSRRREPGGVPRPHRRPPGGAEDGRHPAQPKSAAFEGSRGEHEAAA